MTTALGIDSVASGFDRFPNLLADPQFADDASKMISASALIPKLEVFSASPLGTTSLTQSTSMAPPSYQATTITSPATVIQPSTGLAQSREEALHLRHCWH